MGFNMNSVPYQEEKTNRWTHGATKYQPIFDCKVHHVSNAVWLKTKIALKNLERIWESEEYSLKLLIWLFSSFRKGNVGEKGLFEFNSIFDVMLLLQ